MNQERRSFLRNTVLAAGASMLHADFSILKSKNNSDFPIIGHGKFKYRINQGWGTQDTFKIPVKDCHEMIQSKDGRLFLLTNHTKNNLLIYDASGKVLSTWTLKLPGAHGLTLSDEGGEEFLYITDTVINKVYKTDLKGRVVMELSYPSMISDYEKAEDWKPTETTIAPNGDLYIADGYGKNFIIHYNRKGDYISHFGGSGQEDGQFDCAHGVTLDTRSSTPELLITSRTANAFKRFTMDGNHIETIELPGCWICRPVIHDSNLYFAVIVTKSWGEYDGMVAVLDKNNKVVSFPGGSAPGYQEQVLQAPTSDYLSFLNPHDVCVDKDTNLYVPQWSSGRTYPVKLERV